MGSVHISLPFEGLFWIDQDQRMVASKIVLWRNLNWATFCIKQKCVQIPPYLWCISYIILFLYPLSKSHKKLEVLKHSEEWEQSLDNLKKNQNSVLTHVERLGRWHSLSPMLSFVYANWMARETTLELSCNLWMNLGGPNRSTWPNLRSSTVHYHVLNSNT